MATGGRRIHMLVDLGGKERLQVIVDDVALLFGVVKVKTDQ